MSDGAFLVLVVVGVPLIFVGIYFFLANYVDNQRKQQEATRETNIKAKGWGDFEQSVINHEIEIGMTQEMVLEAWGRPTNMDKQEETEKYKQERWVYGIPRKGSGANYITFRNGVITKKVVNRPVEVSSGLTRGVLAGVLFAVWLVVTFIIVLSG